MASESMAWTIGAVPWNWVQAMRYCLPRSGKASGRRIIQYFISSAGIDQPTRIVGMSSAAWVCPHRARKAQAVRPSERVKRFMLPSPRW